MELIDLDGENLYWKMLLYGLAGSGKTTLIGTAASDDRLAPVLHLDCGGNPTSMRHFKHKPKTLRITKLSDLNVIYDWLLNDQPADHTMVLQARCTPGYKTVVLDGLTRIQFLSFKQALGTNPKPGDMPNKPEWEQYNRVLLHMTNAFVQFYNLKMHVLVTALEDNEKRFYDPDDVRLTSKELQPNDYYIQAVPGIDGKSLERIPGIADGVYRIAHKAMIDPVTLNKIEKEHGKVKYSVLQLQNTKLAYAKDQHMLGMAYIPDPTMKQLTDLLVGS